LKTLGVNPRAKFSLEGSIFMNEKIAKFGLFVLKMLTGIASGYFIVLFLYIGLSRLSFPLPFDWVEGPILAQTNRVLLGQKLYIEPSAAYVPLVYPPVYFYLAALLTKLTSFGMAPARFLSILASLGCCFMIFLIVRKTTSFWFPGLISAGFFAATNGIVWTWFDFAKVDMLCIFLSLLGLYFLIQADIRSTILAGVFFTLSFFSKQSAIIILIPAFLIYLLVNRKMALLFIVITGSLSLAGILLLNIESNGWYYFYTYTLPSYHRLNFSPGQISYILTSILKPVMIFLGLVILAILVNAKVIFKTRLLLFFFGLAGCTLVLSILSAFSVGATRNAFIPAYALFAIVCGIGIQNIQEKISTKYSGNVQCWFNIFLMAACLFQFSYLQYKPGNYIPSAQDFKRAYALIKELKGTDGEFIIPSLNYLALYVDKNVYYHDAPVGEFNGWYGKSLPQWPGIQQEIQKLVTTRQVNFIFITDPTHDWMGLRCEKEKTLQSNSKYVPTLFKMICR
jgi:hypothetical protein